MSEQPPIPQPPPKVPPGLWTAFYIIFFGCCCALTGKFSIKATADVQAMEGAVSSAAAGAICGGWLWMRAKFKLDKIATAERFARGITNLPKSCVVKQPLIVDDMATTDPPIILKPVEKSEPPQPTINHERCLGVVLLMVVVVSGTLCIWMW